MNKQDLKSLLENIYYTLTEEDTPPLRYLPPPEVPTGPPPTPPALRDIYKYDPARDQNWTPNVLYPLGDGWTWRYVNGYWRAYPPVATPVPPKPKPTPTPNPELSNPRPTRIRRFDPRNPYGLPPYSPKPTNGEQRLRDLLRELGIENEVYPSLFN